MGIKCSSTNEKNSLDPENISHINDTIKFNQQESNDIHKNDSFNQILNNINNEYGSLNLNKIENNINEDYQSFSSNKIGNNNSNINSEENSYNQIVKNDIENSYNIADEIRSDYTSNTLMEHGAVLNDNNSFFNNEDIIYATDKLIEINEEFQRDKQVADFKSKMENLRLKEKKIY